VIEPVEGDRTMLKISAFRFRGNIVLFALTAGCCFAQLPPLRSTRPQLVPPPPAPAPAAAAGTPVSLAVAISPPGTALSAGIPVVVTVSARDSNNNPVSNYAGPVQLTAAPAGVIISTSTQANGQFAFSVAFPTTGDFTITAADGSSADLPSVPTNVTVQDHGCAWFPIRSKCYTTISQINGFFSTNSSLSYFNQIKSIYNGASSSATVSADIATLNFWNGMQLTATTNIQAGPSNAPTTPNTGSPAVLSSTESAQAAQNVLYGGTVVASILYPLVFAVNGGLDKPGTLGFSLDFVAREGIDIQNFKSGTSTLVNAPPTHTAAQIEGYLSYNAINPPDSSSGSSSSFAGSIFLGWAYGYSYTSHRYALDYGIPNQSNGLGQISAGILVNGVVKIAVSRGFGPTQIYKDSTSNLTTTVNNFKAWSIGITYQQKAAATQPGS
jgi:hypothetical protein